MYLSKLNLNPWNFDYYIISTFICKINLKNQSNSSSTWANGHQISEMALQSKTLSRNVLARYKARLVEKGYTQSHSIDRQDTTKLPSHHFLLLQPWI
jgi:hypothetical protein